jgi:hypothetical protein
LFSLLKSLAVAVVMTETVKCRDEQIEEVHGVLVKKAGTADS